MSRILFVTNPRLRGETFFLRRSIDVFRRSAPGQAVVFNGDCSTPFLPDAHVLRTGLLHWPATALRIAEIESLFLLTTDLKTPTSIQSSFILAAYSEGISVVERALNNAQTVVHPLHCAGPLQRR